MDGRKGGYKSVRRRRMFRDTLISSVYVGLCPTLKSSVGRSPTYSRWLWQAASAAFPEGLIGRPFYGRFLGDRVTAEHRRARFNGLTVHNDPIWSVG